MGHRSLKRIRSWRVPPNWSRQEWFEEISAEASAAALEAERDFDPTRGIPLPAFVHQRVLARALNRYRREWAFARRCQGADHQAGPEDIDQDRRSFVDSNLSLWSMLDRLPEVQRFLITELFWEGKTEQEVARTLSLSQQAVSKRKRSTIEQLRRWMGRAGEKPSSAEF